MARKEADRRQRHEEAQIERLRELSAAVATLTRTRTDQLATQHDDLINEFEVLNGSVAEALAELQEAVDEAATRHEAMKAMTAERDAELKKLLEDGSVAVTIAVAKKESKATTPKKKAN
jgi:hypothetical protein